MEIIGAKIKVTSLGGDVEYTKAQAGAMAADLHDAQSPILRDWCAKLVAAIEAAGALESAANGLLSEHETRALTLHYSGTPDAPLPSALQEVVNRVRKEIEAGKAKPPGVTTMGSALEDHAEHVSKRKKSSWSNE